MKTFTIAAFFMAATTCFASSTQEDPIVLEDVANYAQTDLAADIELYPPPLPKDVTELAQTKKVWNPKDGEVAFQTPHYTPPSDNPQHCEPNEDQREVLWELFAETAGTKDSITREQWENLLVQHQVLNYHYTPKHWRPHVDVWKDMVGDTNAGNKAYEIDYMQFLESLSRGVEQSYNGWSEGSWNCIVYERLTNDRLRGLEIRKMSYKHVLEIKTAGGGASGSYSREIRTFEGKTTKSTVTRKTSRTMGWFAFFAWGSVTSDFTKVIENIDIQNKEVTHTVNLKLAIPNYVYTQMIEIEYKSGRRQTIKGGIVIRHADDVLDLIVEYDDEGNETRTHVTPDMRQGNF